MASKIVFFKKICNQELHCQENQESQENYDLFNGAHTSSSTKRASAVANDSKSGCRRIDLMERTTPTEKKKKKEIGGEKWVVISNEKRFIVDSEKRLIVGSSNSLQWQCKGLQRQVYNRGATVMVGSSDGDQRKSNAIEIEIDIDGIEWCLQW